MGELFRISNKIKILIYSKDHTPAHVHVVVRAEGIEFKVYLSDLRVEHVSHDQLSASDERMVVKFIKDRIEFIMEAWNEIQRDQ